jgi:MFS family permease
MSFASALVQIPGGYIADKYGRKKIIMTMTFIAGLARFIYILAPSWEWILGGAIIVGFATIYSPALNALIADSVSKEKRGIAFSVINLINGASTTPAPLVAGYLFSIYGLMPSMRIAYMVAATGFIISGLLRSRLKETVASPEKIRLGELLGEYPVSLRESVNVWKFVPRAALIIFIVNIFISFTSGLFQPILVLYAVEDLGIDKVAFSVVWTSLFISMIILAIPIGRLIDNIGKRKPIILSFILWICAVFLYVYGDFYRLILSMIMVGAIMIMLNSGVSALMADLVSQEYRGKVSGSTGFFAAISLSLGQLAGGWLYDNIGHQVPFLIQVLLVIPPMLMVYFWVKEPDIAEI